MEGTRTMGDFFISAEDLSYRLASAEPVRIFDVRRPPAIEQGSRFLPGRRWRNHLCDGLVQEEVR